MPTHEGLSLRPGGLRLLSGWTSKQPSFRPTQPVVFLVMKLKMTPATRQRPGVRIKEIALHDHDESSTAIRRRKPVGHPRLTRGLPAHRRASSDPLDGPTGLSAHGHDRDGAREVHVRDPDVDADGGARARAS